MELLRKFMILRPVFSKATYSYSSFFEKFIDKYNNDLTKIIL